MRVLSRHPPSAHQLIARLFIMSAGDSSTPAVPVAAPASVDPATSGATPLSATQLKKIAKASKPYVPPVDANGERLYPRKSKAPSQKQRRDLIAEQNPNRLNLRRWGHTCNTIPASSVHGERLIAFGGWGADSVGLSRTVDHRLDSIAELATRCNDKFEWTNRNTTGKTPQAREQHTAVVIPAVIPADSSSSSPPALAAFSSLTCRSPHLLVFGGRSNPSRALSDVRILNLDTFEWLDLPTPEMGPGITSDNLARFRHTAVWAEHRMIVYGGCRYETTPHDDASASVTAPKNTTTMPPPGAPCTNHTVFNDILVLDTSVSPMRWERITIDGYAESKPSSNEETPIDVSDTAASTHTAAILPSLPYKHSHAATYCPDTRAMFILGGHVGYADGDFHHQPTDHRLYRLSMGGGLATPSTWRWECLSSSMTGIPPPPLASGSVHLLSPHLMLVLGGVSSEDMYALSSLWLADLRAMHWSRPFLHPGTHTRFHPRLERPRAVQENIERQRMASHDPQLEDATIALGAGRIADTIDPVRIVEHAFMCKHAAVAVSAALFGGSGDGASLDLILCGGGGNVFHFNPFFNPTLHFQLRIREDQVDLAANGDAIESCVEVKVQPIQPITRT